MPGVSGRQIIVAYGLTNTWGVPVAVTQQILLQSLDNFDVEPMFVEDNSFAQNWRAPDEIGDTGARTQDLQIQARFEQLDIWYAAGFGRASVPGAVRRRAPPAARRNRDRSARTAVTSLRGVASLTRNAVSSQRHQRPVTALNIGVQRARHAHSATGNARRLQAVSSSARLHARDRDGDGPAGAADAGGALRPARSTRTTSSRSPRSRSGASCSPSATTA